MSLEKEIDIIEIIEEDLQPNLTYYMDFDKGRIIGRIDGLEAIDQFVRKALITQRFKFIIYDAQYGSEMYVTVYNDNTTNDLIIAELPRIITDCLIYDPRIEEVYDFSFDMNHDYLYIYFHVRTIFGTIGIETTGPLEFRNVI